LKNFKAANLQFKRALDALKRELVIRRGAVNGLTATDTDTDGGLQVVNEALDGLIHRFYYSLGTLKNIGLLIPDIVKDHPDTSGLSAVKDLLPVLIEVQERINTTVGQGKKRCSDKNASVSAVPAKAAASPAAPSYAAVLTNAAAGPATPPNAAAGSKSAGR
jgi:hypothetical protein